MRSHQFILAGLSQQSITTGWKGTSKTSGPQSMKKNKLPGNHRISLVLCTLSYMECSCQMKWNSNIFCIFSRPSRKEHKDRHFLYFVQQVFSSYNIPGYLHISSVDWFVCITLWSNLKLGTDTHVVERMNPSGFVYLRTFSDLSPRVSCLWLSIKYLLPFKPGSHASEICLQSCRLLISTSNWVVDSLCHCHWIWSNLPLKTTQSHIYLHHYDYIKAWSNA